jgi:predicted enzyme related to lactoylglutathione lyase
MNEVFKQQGAVSWTELMTTDVEGAKAFYSQLFGWRLEAMPMPGGEGSYHVIHAGDNQVGGIMQRPPQAGDAPPAWGSYVTVDQVDAVAERARELGGQVLFGPQDIPGVGRFCVIRDPQGAVISAITYVPCEA